MASGQDLDRTISRAARRPGAKKSARAVVTAVQPADVDWRIEIGSTRVVIGRAENDGVAAIGHETVSRAHIAIAYDTSAKGYRIEDLGSHNGTRVNGTALAKGGTIALDDNTVIEVGDVLLVFERAVDVTAEKTRETSEIAERIPGAAARMSLVRALIARAAPDPSPVLIVGETGTGKEWIAREVHRRSGRKGQLLAINCAALSAQLIESQLFGHVKGAFTGAASDHAGFFVEAEGGTLFLDELGELPAELQPKLLRVLQEREVRPVGGSRTRAIDVRVIAATNRDLALEVREGRFRRDLFARLALWEVSLPPLRERRVDIMMWLERLHRAWASERGSDLAPPVFTVEAAAALLLHDWADNLRGLDRLVHALSASNPGGRVVDREHLPDWVRPSRASSSSPGSSPVSPSSSPGDTSTSDAASDAASRLPVPTREEFAAVLEEVDGNVSALAKHFGRDRRQIYRWLDSFGLRDKRQGRKSDS